MDFVSAFQLAISGQEEGYRFLYDSTCQPVYGFLLQNTAGKEAADLMIGKVYEKAWAGLGGLADPNEFPGWVQRIAEELVRQEQSRMPVPPVSDGITPGANGGMTGGETGLGQMPHVQAEASPNMAHIASSNAQQMASPNMAHAGTGLEQMSAGSQAMTGAGVGASGTGASAAVTGAKAAAGAKAAFLSTAAGKVIVGVGVTIAAAAMITGGYVAAKKLTKKDKPTTETTEVSSAMIETEEVSEGTESTEAVTEAETTEEAAVDVHQLYEAYLTEKLIPERGIHQARQEKLSQGRKPDGEGPTGAPWFNGTGIYTVDFDDYDLDGEEEMLVISGRTAPPVNDYTDVSYVLQAEIYNAEKEQVVLASVRDISGGYDGYEGGGFPRVLTKVKGSDGIYLVSYSQENWYNTAASSHDYFTLFQTKGEFRPLMAIAYQCALGYGYDVTVTDSRVDPENPTESKEYHDINEDPSLKEKTNSQMGLLFQEIVQKYFSDWHIEADQNGAIVGTVILDMELESDSSKYYYLMTDAYGFHSKGWVTPEDGKEPGEEEKTEETGNPGTDDSGLLPFTDSMTFWFLSGAGAWDTQLELKPDGTFSGNYHDTNMGETGDGFENGTMYLSVFEGRFKNITKVDDYTYRMELDYYTTEEPAHTEEIKDQVLYKYWDPYGIEGGYVFYFYLPGKPKSELDDAFLSWVWLADPDLKNKSTWDFFGLYNEAMGEGFFNDGY